MSEPSKGTWQYIGGINLSIPGLPSSGHVYEVTPPLNPEAREALMSERVVLLTIREGVNLYTCLVSTDRRNQSIGVKALSTMSGLYDARTLFGLLGYRASSRINSPLVGKGAQGGEGAQTERRTKRQEGEL